MSGRGLEQPPTLLARLSSDQMQELFRDQPRGDYLPSRILLRRCQNCREYLTATQDTCCGVPVPRRHTAA